MLISGELSSGTVVHIEAEPSSAASDKESSVDECGVPLKKKAKIPSKLRFRVEDDKASTDAAMEYEAASDENWEMMMES